MNYAAHNQELHGTLKRPDEPVIFTKADSAILNQGKPFFIPDHLGRIDYETEVVVRICRLGKNIPEKFANRYYDAVAPGVDFIALDKAREAQAAGLPWTTALAFDYSLAIGEWGEAYPRMFYDRPLDAQSSRALHPEGKGEEWLMSPEEAIAQASKVMTIRQGDLIYIQKKQAPRVVHKEDIIRKEIDGEEKLYCKIK